MKRFKLLFIFILSIVNIFAQEPGNNLHQSLEQIKQKFPNLTYFGNESKYKKYKSKGEKEDFTSFYFYNNKLVGEYTYIFDYTNNSRYINNLYLSLISKFSTYKRKYRRNSGQGYDVVFFYFSDFIIKVAKYDNQLQLYYELKGYNINISALQAQS